jgi:phosphoribosylpyrophosphate synthetase
MILIVSMDDMFDTADTLCKAADVLAAEGARLASAVLWIVVRTGK